MPAKAPANGRPLRLAFVGQAVERKGLPILLRAFEALREHIPVELLVIGAGDEDVAPLMLDPRGVRALGKVSDERKHAALASADLLVAPSLGGESFGMVLTEGFAAGTPVVASDIAGYRDVVHDGVDGVLVPRGDATALAETLRDLALDPRAARAMAEQAARAARAATPGRRSPREVLGAYEDAIAMPAPGDGPRAQRACSSARSRPTAARPRRPSACRASSPRRREARSPLRRHARRAAIGVAGLARRRAVVDGAAAHRPRPDRPEPARRDPVVGGRGARPHVPLDGGARGRVARDPARGDAAGAPAPADALQGTFIGVLMSATLPARLGEPSRALIVARRTGRPREHLPTVIGTIVSQTLLNIVALVMLGVVMFSTVSLFSERHKALWLFALAPLADPRGRAGRAGAAARRRAVALASRAGVGRAARAPRRRRCARACASSATPGSALAATVLQLGAWAIQWLSCYALLVALGLDDLAGMGAAAAVLFAVNVTAVLPATPSNLGVFQAACVAVLASYHVGYADALAYGIILQAVEIATAVVMGAPALVREGLSWRDVRMRAMHTSPVELEPLPAGGQARAKA